MDLNTIPLERPWISAAEILFQSVKYSDTIQLIRGHYVDFIIKISISKTVMKSDSLESPGQWVLHSAPSLNWEMLH